MNRILYENRCKCNEEFSITKKRKSNSRSEGKPLQYPKPSELTSKIFQIEYHENLSLTAKFILNSFQNKYIYYAIDDILYSFRSNPIERDNLLAVLYSPILSLQNNFLVNFTINFSIHFAYVKKRLYSSRSLNCSLSLFTAE